MADIRTITLNDVEVYLDSRTAVQWGLVKRIIPKGFMCVELAENKCRLKVGDGTLTYAELPYVGGDIDTAELEQILSDYYTKSETDNAISAAIQALGTLFKFKGRVDTAADLPASDNEQGDVYLVGAADASEFEEYYWSGTMWDYMGKTGSVDLSDYYKKSEVDSLLNNKANESDMADIKTRVSNIEGDYIKSTDKLILNCSLS